MMNTELKHQKKHVTDIVHYLLDGPENANWQWNGKYPTRKLMIEIPEAFAYLAFYLEKLAQNPGSPVKGWEQLEKSFFNARSNDAVYRSIKQHIKNNIHPLLWNEYHDTFHLFFHGYDWRLLTEEERKKEEENKPDDSQFGKWDYDDDLPF
jgi:hypothetical protein